MLYCSTTPYPRAEYWHLGRDNSGVCGRTETQPLKPYSKSYALLSLLSLAIFSVAVLPRRYFIYSVCGLILEILYVRCCSLSRFLYCTILGSLLLSALLFPLCVELSSSPISYTFWNTQRGEAALKSQGRSTPHDDRPIIIAICAFHQSWIESPISS